MTLRFFLLFLLGALPLAAQSAVHNADKLDPDQVPGVEPSVPVGPAMMQPGVTAPPPGAPPVLPERPAEPIIVTRIVEFTIEPGTVREAMFSKYTLRTTIKLNVPAKKDMLCHVVSSDLIKVVATDITIIKGHGDGFGGLQINWTAIKRDCHVEFKAYDVDRPDDLFYGRIYIHKLLGQDRPKDENPPE
jgi:hypothetical protein